jgi:hypothetical protein
MSAISVEQVFKTVTGVLNAPTRQRYAAGGDAPKPQV